MLNVPGLVKTSASFVNALLSMSSRNGWDPSGIAAVIASESNFNPAAKNPGSSASGLIQFIDSTARSLGTTTAALRNMGAVEQLQYVERFFQRNMPKLPANIADYKLVVLGRGDLVGAPDDSVVYSGSDPKQAAAYSANRTLDREGKGYISVGDIRSLMSRYTSPSLGELDMKKLAVAAGGVELLAWAALGFFAWRKARSRSNR